MIESTIIRINWVFYSFGIYCPNNAPMIHYKKKKQIKVDDRIKAIAGMDVKVTAHSNIECLLPYDREMVIDVRGFLLFEV